MMRTKPEGARSRLTGFYPITTRFRGWMTSEKMGCVGFGTLGAADDFGLHEGSRIDVDGDRFAEGERPGEDPLRSSICDEAGTVAGTLGKDLQLHPVAGGDSSDRAGEGAPDLDSVLALKRSEPIGEGRRQSGGLSLATIADHDPGEPSGGGKLEAFAIREFLFGKAFVIVFRGPTNGGSVGLEGLDDGLSGRRAATASADHLSDELERSLAGSKIGHVQCGVRIDHTDEPHAGKIEPFGDHLGPGKQPDFAGSEPFQNVMEVISGMHGVRIDPDHGADSGEIWVKTAEILLDPLRAQTEDRGLLAAEWTGGG
jgi:hypothetical protein